MKTMMYYLSMLFILWVPGMSISSMVPGANQHLSTHIEPFSEGDDMDGPKWFDYKKHVNSKGFFCCKPKDNRKCGWQVVCPGYDPPGPPNIE
jgi:hypothetical protein